MNITLLGYGSQGRAHALNLRDSGYTVRLGLRPGPSFDQAEADGFAPLPPAEAVVGADLVSVLVPDMAQPAVLDQVLPHLQPGALLLFAHGFTVHYDRVALPAHLDVALVAPKAPGALVRREYEADIRRVKDLIARGETYQVNYTMRLEADFDGDPLGFFAAMARAQRSADHLAYLDFGDRAACSASPELFIRRCGRTLESRPMKGTRPRHPDPVNDADIVRELLESEKDRAENTMIVDMVRNDLGRIGDTGSLMTSALHTVESFSTVHQLTSTVEVQTDAGLFDVFAATFPGASITGAPKVNTAGFIKDAKPRRNSYAMYRLRLPETTI